MSETLNNKRGWRMFRRILIGLAIFATVVAIFYTEEDWRGKRAWEKCKTELEAKGAVLGWDKYIPPTVLDDQNFFMASTNILLRFHKAQTPAESDAATQLSWLRLPPLGSNSFPVFVTTTTNPLVVAQVTVAPPAFTPLAAGGGYLLVVKFNAADAREKVQDLIHATVGRGIHGAAGFQFSERQLSNLAPAQILLQSDAPSSVAELENFIPVDLVTNVGRLKIEATGDKNLFRVLMTDVHVTAAADYLKWSDQFVPALDEIREALKRPYALIPGDYSVPYAIPIPNFVTMRSVAQTLAQRAQCFLLLSRPDKALREITLMHDVCRILEKPPTGKPETLVEAMINVAITGLYVNTIADGFRLHAWQEPQLVALQGQLARIDLPPFLAKSFKTEPASVCRTFEITMVRKLFAMPIVPAGGRSFWQKVRDLRFHVFDLVPRGWVYQNMVTVARLDTRHLDGFDFENGTILPGKIEELRNEVEKIMRHPSPYTYIAVIGVPNATRAMQTLAYNQTMANEAQIVCALERYHLARGEYPETLDALAPQFIEKLPHDLIGGQPLHYRQTADGKFLLYSVGWNEKDEGGKDSPPALNGGINYAIGDWVWKN